MTANLTRLAIVLAVITMTVAPRPARAQQGAVHTVAAADPQVKDDLFAGTERFAQGATDVSEVNLDPGMLGMVSSEKSGDLAHKMSFMVVHKYRYPKPGMYKMEDVEAYRQKLKTGSWSCFIHVSESKTGKSSDICRQSGPDNLGNEMVIITVEPMELTFIHIGGIASLADLGKLGGLGSLGSPNKNSQPPPPAAVPK